MATPDGRVERSAYRRLADDLRAMLLQGRFSGGVQLPTETELADQYAVSRQTVRRAFQDLVSEGLVYRVPGRGTFAEEREGPYLRQFGSIEDLMSFAVDTEMTIIQTPHRRIDIDVAGRLHLSSDVVWQTEFVRNHSGTTFCHTTISLAPEIGSKLDDASELREVGATSMVTVIGLLEGRLDEPIAQADQSITAVRADGKVSAILDCPEGSPLLRIDRLYLTADGTPVELATSYFVPDRYSYRLRLKRRAP